MSRVVPHQARASFTRRVGLMLLLACQAATAAESEGQPGAARFGAGDQAATVGAPADVMNFGQESASPAVTHIAQWVVTSRDNGGMSYLIIDKVNAKVFVFNAAGHLQGAAAALLGSARGDDSAEGVGNQKMSAILPKDRTTPAGRFVASLGQGVHGNEILWVDYTNAIALHPVAKGTPQERRAQRLQSATVTDNRISFGCINVPLAFYEKFVSPAFANTGGVVYILPETRSARGLFGSYGDEASTPTYDQLQP
jgi:hypothetical protein